MKISVDKTSFIKSWNLAERSAGTSSSMNIFSTIRLNADTDRVEMQATDIKTSIICEAKGVTVIEPGEVVIPLKGAGDLFKKAGSEEFTLQIDDGKAVMISGKSRYRFTTYPAADFPKLPSSTGGTLFCSLVVSDLAPAIERGTLCASVNDEYPQYLCAANFEKNKGTLKIASTDNKRLAVSSTEAESAEESGSLLLPMKGIKELQRILGMLGSDTVINILFDDSQVYFVADEMEFAVRRVESKFPDYTRVIPTECTSRASIDRLSLISALERVDIIVRDYDRTVIINLNPEGECTLSGRAREFGEAVENLSCTVDGDPIRIGVNTRFFHDALKVLDEPVVNLKFNGTYGHMSITPDGSDSFLYLLAPVENIGSHEEDCSSESELNGDVL